MTLKEKILRLIHLTLQRFQIVQKNPYNFWKLTRTINLSILYARIAGVPGSIVECGIAQGNTLATLKILSLAHEDNRDIYGFDTFRGLPEPASFEQGTKGDFGYSRQSVIQFFKDTRISLDRITLLEGDIRDTLPLYKGKIGLIAFLHIDVDLYDGYKAALENLWPYISEGGIVLFDDYGVKAWAGADRAVDEFAEAHNIKIQHIEYANKSYFVKD